MKILLVVIWFTIISLPSTGLAGVNIPGQQIYGNEIDVLLEGAIADGLISGGVVLIGDSRANLFCRAYGKLSGSHEAGPVEPDSLFDIASLTKVVATTPAVMKLVEEGRVGLYDPVSRWFPEFGGRGKDDLLVLHLLTHTSGLRDLSPSAEITPQDFVRLAASQQLRERPGARFQYTDINFILLGELVGRAGGVQLDSYAASRIFNPLHMSNTGFNPDARSVCRCAATLNHDNSFLFGRVQDKTAFLLGGVAGHAGIFSTAYDLSLFCRMVLNKGAFDGQNVLSFRTVTQTTTPYSINGGKVLRGLGWDIASPFSSPRGAAFSAESFGHTGFSGSSVWLDPETDVFVVLLTVRLDYKRKKLFNQLRGDLSTKAGQLVAGRRRMLDFARKSE